MSGSIPLLSPYALMACTGATLPTMDCIFRLTVV
jgi:hypothetical protein